MPSSKIRDFLTRNPIALTDLVYLVDSLVGAGGNYKAQLSDIFIASGIFYVPVGAPDISLGVSGNYAFRGDGTAGSYLYYKTQVVAGFVPRRQRQQVLSRSGRRVITWNIHAGAANVPVAFWTAIL